MKTQDIKRKAAASLLNDIMLYVAQKIESSAQPPPEWAEELKEKFEAAGLKLPTQCIGEAHSNPHVDNCSVCMPNWGWSGREVKVK